MLDSLVPLTGAMVRSGIRRLDFVLWSLLEIEETNDPFSFLWLILDNVDGMKTVETPETLWGEGKTDESKALEENKFEMRKCFLAKVPGKKGARKRRPRKRSGKKEGEKGENGKAADNGEKKAEAAKASS